MKFIQKKFKISLYVLFTVTLTVFAGTKPFLTTFKNTTSIAIVIAQTFADQSTANNTVAAGASFQVANFTGKALASVNLTSNAKDSKGNAYGDCTMKFTVPTANMNYNLALKGVPAHTVPAAGVIPAFTMPASQAIICTLAT